MHRNGFASLLALVVLVAAATMVAGALAVARSAALRDLAGDRNLASSDLLIDGERFACRWLDRHAQSIVLPPAGGCLLIADAHWNDAAGRPMRLAVAIHDDLASLPRPALVAGHPLRMALASPGSGPVLRGNPESILPADLLARVDLPSGWTRLPDQLPEGQPVGSCIPESRCAPGQTLGFWFSPDNATAINANTAPASLLRAACASLSTDPELIIASRRDGHRWNGPAIGGNGLQLVSASSRWHLLLAIEVAGTCSVRWAVADGTAGRFTIIRRSDVRPAPAPTSGP